MDGTSFMLNSIAVGLNWWIWGPVIYFTVCFIGQMLEMYTHTYICKTPYKIKDLAGSFLWYVPLINFFGPALLLYNLGITWDTVILNPPPEPYIEESIEPKKLIESSNQVSNTDCFDPL